MNNKGQVAIYTMMLAITIIVLALALAPAIRDFTRDAMSATVADTIGLDCDNPSNDFISATCVVTDMTNFYFMGILIFMAGVIVTAKVMF